MKILITGASRGIGLYLLKRFHEEGVEVCGTYSKTKPEEQLTPFFTQVDITDNESVKKWIGEKVSEKDEIVLINCAGTNYNVLARKADVDEWQKVIDVNLVGAFRAINAVLPLMYEKGFGRIINFASVVPQLGLIGTSAYAASKSALWGLAKTIAKENGHKGITCNNINLGYVNAGMALTDVPEKLREKMIQQIPIGKLGALDDVYKTVRYLMDTAYITGASLDVNGGLF